MASFWIKSDLFLDKSDRPFLIPSAKLSPKNERCFGGCVPRFMRRLKLRHTGNCRVECHAANVSWPSRVSRFGSHDHVDETIYFQLVYLANLATMIPINLLYRRFDNLLRTISEIVTRGIVLAIREWEKLDKKEG
jgi:hypothetical protein